ncbi:MAG: hypothetical protein HQK87_09370 [Nitrospinae bacterium]|nr:hypothetical protein [Nitrospinota bacterium]
MKWGMKNCIEQQMSLFDGIEDASALQGVAMLSIIYSFFDNSAQKMARLFAKLKWAQKN